MTRLNMALVITRLHGEGSKPSYNACFDLCFQASQPPDRVVIAASSGWPSKSATKILQLKIPDALAVLSRQVGQWLIVR